MLQKSLTNAEALRQQSETKYLRLKSKFIDADTKY